MRTTPRPRGLLALEDRELVAALGAAGDGELRVAYERFDARAARDRCRAAGLVAICRHDSRYPARLGELPDPPAVLHIAGDVERFHVWVTEPAVAVVGARRATSYGLDVAQSLGRALATAGLPVVSGLALGVDSAAHAGALDGDGPSIAVLGSGADVPYPASKTWLHRELVRRGVVVSEMPPGFRAHPWSFPARNRIIAALAQLTVVVEAAERSGSLITATFALELGRTVGAVPGPITSTAAAGTNELLAQGARVVRGAQDVLDELFGVGVMAAPVRDGSELEPRLQGLLAAIAGGSDTFGALARLHADVPAGLAELELLGYVRRHVGGRYVPTA